MKKAAGIIITLLLFTQLSRAQLSWNWAQSGNVPPGGRITSNDIAMDDAGNVYTCGAYIPQINNYSDLYIAKYNATGNLLWFKTFGSQKSDEAYSITLDTNKNIYITGYYGAQFITPVVNDSIYFDHLFLPSIGGTADIFLAKFDMNGNAIWAKNMGNQMTHDWGLSLTADKKGHLVVTGMFGNGVSDTSTSRFDTISLLSHKNSDVFIAKYDTSGNIIWGVLTVGFML